MGRPPDGGTARTETIRCRVTPAVKAQVTRLRRSLSESDYIRHLIAEDAKRRDQ